MEKPTSLLVELGLYQIRSRRLPLENNVGFACSRFSLGKFLITPCRPVTATLDKQFSNVPSSCLGQTEFLILGKKKRKSKIKKMGQLIPLCGLLCWKGCGSVHRKMRQELQLRPLSSLRDRPVSPTVPFQSNQRGEAGSGRNDIEGAQLFPTELGRGMPGEVYWVMRPPAHPPACLSPGRAAGIMGTPRLRS